MLIDFTKGTAEPYCFVPYCLPVVDQLTSFNQCCGFGFIGLNTKIP
jgi:hypothetical protein